MKYTTQKQNKNSTIFAISELGSHHVQNPIYGQQIEEQLLSYSEKDGDLNNSDST